MNKVQQIIEGYNQIGAKFLGAIVQFEVNTGYNGIKVSDINNAVILNPDIPNDLAPEMKNPLSLYLDAIREVSSMHAKHLIVSDPYKFRVNEHGGYLVHKMSNDRLSQNPFSHRIVRKTKTRANLSDGKINLVNASDAEYDNACVITLVRESGLPSDDALRKSVLKIHPTLDGRSSNPHDFEPFIDTLEHLFQEKCDGVYTADQIRDFITTTLQKLRCSKIGRGMWFADVTSLPIIYALRDELRLLGKVEILSIPLPKYEVSQDISPLVNTGLHQVQGLLADSFLQDAQKMLQDLKDLQDKANDPDRKVRSSTWEKRLEEFASMRDKIDEYRKQELLSTDILKDMMEEIKEIILENI